MQGFVVVNHFKNFCNVHTFGREVHNINSYKLKSKLTLKDAKSEKKYSFMKRLRYFASKISQLIH